MKIYVNNEELKFQLDKDLSISEVLNEIQEWADKEKLFILNYNTSPEFLNKDKEVILSSEVEKLNIELGGHKDLIINNLTELLDYIDNIGAFLASHIQEKKEISNINNSDIIAGIDWILQSTDSQIKNLRNLSETQEVELLDSTSYIASNKKNLNTILLNEDGLNFIKHLSNIRTQIFNWIQQFHLSVMNKEEIDDKKNIFLSSIKDIITKLEIIAENLTLGKEAEALQLLEEVIVILSDGIAILNVANTNEKLIPEIIKILNELTSSLSISDLVTAADIIEFDLPELLEKLI